MKKFIDRVHDLGQRAAQLKQVVEAAPAQAAQLREAVLLTASEIQQLRLEAQSGFSGLRADSDDRLAQALREIHAGADAIRESGYALAGIDMDLSPSQRVIVHLERLSPAPEPAIRSLMSHHAGQAALHGVLGAIAKAETVSASMQVPGLLFRELIVHIGPTPSVRLCWWPESEGDHARPQPPPISLATAADRTARATAHPAAAQFVTPPPMPAFAQSSYFEPRTPSRSPSSPASQPTQDPAPDSAYESAPHPAPEASPTTSSLAPTAHPGPGPTEGGWTKNALDRFKKMPDVSKYRR
jgi:hypothetical protein